MSAETIKIKAEILDPEVEEKIKSVFAIKEESIPTSSRENEEQNSAVIEDKKSIQPVKSSSEILAELFQVFNAAPPKELIDDNDLLRKHNKRKKHKKHSTKEKNTDAGKTDDSVSSSSRDSGMEKSIEKKHKHRRKKKHKHKEKDRKDKGKRKHAKESGKGRNKEREGKKTKVVVSSSILIKTELEGHDLDTKQIIKCRKRRSGDTLPKEHTKKKAKMNDHRKEIGGFYNGFNERMEFIKVKVEGAKLSADNNKDERNGQCSDISLSDEETYLQEKERANGHITTNNTRMRNSFYAGMEQARQTKNRRRARSRCRSRSHSKYRSRSRSRSLGIDKKRLLEIARKNAISMFKRGNLPGCEVMTDEVKDKVLLKMRYGGRTVQDLTNFCKKISNGEHLSDLSSDEDSDIDKGGNAKAFHHPFQLKEREPIVMQIRNAVPVTLRKTEDMTKAITRQFPVSSGQQHRLTEAWVPVEKKVPLKPLPVLPAAMQAPSIFRSNIFGQKNVFDKSVPQEQQEPAFKPVVGQTAASAIPTDALPPTDMTVSNIPACVSDDGARSSQIVTVVSPTPPVSAPPFVPEVPVPSAAPSDNVFAEVTDTQLDVSNIISKRLNAIRRLQENPMDSEALKMMYNSQRDMTSWVSSKHLPGQFTGSTGVNVLKAHELNSGPQLWARRDQLTSTQPVTGGMGMHLLQKMGWKPGEGLGREKSGSLQPLLLDVKLDKRGLVSKEDNSGYRRQSGYIKNKRSHMVMHSPEELQNKHPVCLLNELTSKRKWTPPLYTLVNDEGPSHSKLFTFSVAINGLTYNPNQASNTKKEAKMIAARYCLQQLGILPT